MKPSRDQKAGIGCVGGGVARRPDKKLFRIARLLPNDEGMRSFEEAQALAKTMPWWSRVGMVRDHGVWCPIGTIDAGYRGEIQTTLFNHGDVDYKVLTGDRIAQLVFSPVVLPGAATFPAWPFLPLRQVETLEDLGDSDRGTSGFGSTGR